MNVHDTAVISSSAELGVDVEIGPYSVIGDHVRLGAGSRVGAFCHLGITTGLANNQSLKVGARAIIRSHSVLYSGSTIGDDLVTGHHVCIRENSIIGTGVQIGSRSDVQGDCEIGDFTKLHADVHVGKKSIIGKFCWLFPDVLLTNDPIPPSEILNGPKISDYVVIASKALLFPGVRIGSDSFVSAASVVKNDVDRFSLVSGDPAKRKCDIRILRMPDDPRLKAYPWRFRFQRGYPEQVQEDWKVGEPGND